MSRPPYMVVLPYAVKDWAEQCIGTMRLQEEGRVLLIDNTITNLGIMRSHNIALDLRHEDEWLIIMSAALRFGPQGGLDFIDNLVERADHGIISAAHTFGWHMVAFRPDVVAKMGRWDENFSPYGMDDLDLSVRIHKAMPDVMWGGYPVEAVDMGMAHSIKVGGVRTQEMSRLFDYWRNKWGAEPGSEFDAYNNKPFNNISHDVNYWPPFKDATWNAPAPAAWNARWL